MVDSAKSSTAAAPRVDVRSVYTYGRWPLSLYTIVLALFSLVDQYSVYTVPIRSWLAVISIGLALSLLLAIFWTFNVARLGSSNQDHFKVELERGTENLALLRQKPLTALDSRVLLKSSAQLTYAIASVIVYTWALIQVAFIVSYIRDTPDFESQFDTAGVFTGLPASFTLQKKLFLLNSIQIGAILTTVLLVPGWALERFMTKSPKFS